MTKRRQRRQIRPGEWNFGQELYYGALVGLACVAGGWLLAMASKMLGVVP